jgi:hypothetical protein
MAPILSQPESWEQKEIQIKLERAEEFAKLTPDQQNKILAEEKIKFEKTKAAAREDLGYKPFKPGQKKAETIRQEDEEKARELAKFEGGDKGKRAPGAPEQKDKPKEMTTPEMKRFMEIFNAAVENISGKKPFEFTSMSVDNLGQPAKHHAIMKKLVDHSQFNDLKPEEISRRLQHQETSPWQIGLQIEIDMGEDQKNHLGLTNLALELSVASLMDGHFSEKLVRFTNLAFFAAALHKKNKEKQMAPPKDVAKKNELKIDQTSTNQAQKFGVSKIGEDAALAVVAPAIAIGPNAPAIFAFNQGSIWGTIDSQGTPANPKELQETLDKISKEN